MMAAGMSTRTMPDASISCPPSSRLRFRDAHTISATPAKKHTDNIASQINPNAT